MDPRGICTHFPNKACKVLNSWVGFYTCLTVTFHAFSTSMGCSEFVEYPSNILDTCSLRKEHHSWSQHGDSRNWEFWISGTSHPMEKERSSMYPKQNSSTPSKKPFPRVHCSASVSVFGTTIRSPKYRQANKQNLALIWILQTLLKNPTFTSLLHELIWLVSTKNISLNSY